MSILDGPEFAASAASGTDWFLEDWRNSRRGSASRTTLLAGTAAASRTHRSELYGYVNFFVLREIEDLLTVLDQQRQKLARQLDASQTRAELDLQREKEVNTRLEQRTKELEASLGRYALRLTGNQMAVIGATIGLIGMVATIMTIAVGA